MLSDLAHLVFYTQHVSTKSEYRHISFLFRLEQEFFGHSSRLADSRGMANRKHNITSTRRALPSAATQKTPKYSIAVIIQISSPAKLLGKLSALWLANKATVSSSASGHWVIPTTGTGQVDGASTCQGKADMLRNMFRHRCLPARATALHLSRQRHFCPPPRSGFHGHFDRIGSETIRGRTFLSPPLGKFSL